MFKEKEENYKRKEIKKCTIHILDQLFLIIIESHYSYRSVKKKKKLLFGSRLQTANGRLLIKKRNTNKNLGIDYN
jgi:ribosomal protein L34